MEKDRSRLMNSIGVGFIFLFIVFGVAMMAGILILNLKMVGGRIKLYEWLVRVACSIGMRYGMDKSLTSIPLPGQEHDYMLFMLMTGILILPQFLASDYIQYRKNRDDIETAQKTVRKAVIWIIGTMSYFAVTIWFYLTV